MLILIIEDEQRLAASLQRGLAEEGYTVDHAAEAHGLALHATVAPDVALSAQASPLAEVVDNLLSNAVKYTPPGGRIDLRLAHGDGAARLFDRFYRSDDAAVQARPGSGLGLAIVRAIVEGYGGGVAAQSDGLGRGSTFEVRLPCLACVSREAAPRTA